MNNIDTLENEYKDFMIKLNKIADDLKKEISKLSPENKDRLKTEIRNRFSHDMLQLFCILNCS